MITASALTRLRNCPSSAVLPRAENHSEWADAGHDAHEELAIFTSDHPFAHLLPPSPRAEVKLAYDVATREGRIIGEGGGRDYGSPGPFEIVGSCDVLGVERDRVVVLDWKSGYSDVEPASSNWQLWFYALAACRALGLSSAIVRIVYTQSRRVDEYEIDALELADFASQLERLHVRIGALTAAYQRGEPMETREGSWCKYCASKPYCPSKTALIKQMAGLTVIGDAVTPATAATAYEQVVRVEQLVREARKRLETYVDEQGPIDLGGGRMFGRYVREGNERLSGDVAMRAIAAVVGESAEEFVSVAIERKTTKAAIERAAKQLGCRRGTAGQVIKKIRELGGATNAADSMPVGEYVAGKNEPAERPALDVDALNRALTESA
jgi:hypothetical protein